jgi:hypothetical protein
VGYPWLEARSPKPTQSRGIESQPSRTPLTLELRKHQNRDPLTCGFGRGIKGKITTKVSHEILSSNPQEQGPENTPRKPPREGSKNHHQEQPGTTQQRREEPRRIIYTYNGGSYKVWLVARSSNPLTKSHHEALKLVLWKS